ncbi:hypothetical protein AA309_11575 [Microvirga vignae]|uniref:DUF305 domain-containing protein n=1 Tax=Microvirga vignae TaxID=1225564 RepID=A0A0H1RCP4_9HYPH|nr:DUF305 domain-containing protein [Microvirga vignae]KLK92978.1 hypothetical protein AA309_11575 [Microvirga vignae]
MGGLVPSLPLRLLRWTLLSVLLCEGRWAWAQDIHPHQPPAAPEQTAPASASASFDILIAQAMDRMHAAMAAVPRTSQPDRDFLAAMVPHHQGAIDMAKAVLLVTTDPRIRNLAQSIITEQQYEIDLMTRLLAEMPDHAPPAQENAP